MQSPFAYRIHIPPAIAPDQRYPVIFALHGIGYSEQDILSVVADLEEEFILIAVRGHLSYNQAMPIIRSKNMENRTGIHSMKAWKCFKYSWSMPQTNIPSLLITDICWALVREPFSACH